MWRTIIQSAVSFIALLPYPNLAYSGSISTENSTVNGVGLGDSPTLVVSKFGEPEAVWIANELLEAAAQGHEVAYRYAGIEFHFENSELEWINITSDDYILANGLGVGSKYSGDLYLRIGNSDCGLEFYTTNEVIERMKIYCIE